MKEQNKAMSAEEVAKEIYREYPTNPKDKPDWKYNRDANCFKKRKAFIKGAKWYEQNILSQRIDELAERINDYKKEVYLFSNKQLIPKDSILKIANDFKAELNLQTDQNQSGN